MIVDTSISQPQPLPTSVRSSEDIVDHLDKVLKAQPPEVQAAVDHAHGIMGLNPPSGMVADAPESSAGRLNTSPATDDTPSVNPSGSGVDYALLSAPTQSVVSSAGLAQPLPSASVAPNPHMQNLERMTAEGPGVNKIHNPFLRGLAHVGDAIGSGLFPEFTSFIPGFTAHHNELLNEEENQLGQEQKATKAADESAQSQAATEHEQGLTSAIPGETGLRSAQADEAAARAESLRHPLGAVKDEELLYDKNGAPIGYRDKQGKYYGPEDPSLPQGVRDVLTAAKPKFSTENVHVLPDGKVVAIHADKDGKPVSEVVYQGDPKIETEVAKLEINGKPHTVLVNKKDGTTIKDLGETGEKPPTVNIANQDHQEAMKGKELLDKAETQYRAAVQGANTLTDFVKSAQAGNKVTAQALPLEGALEITTTAGTKRINRTEVENYAGAGSLWDNIMGKLGKLKEGQPIPKDVQGDSIKLAKILQSNAYKTYKDAHTSAVKRYKLTGEEPLPEPGTENLPDGGGKKLDQATAQKFYDAAGGDPAKARELAAQHKWVP